MHTHETPVCAGWQVPRDVSEDMLKPYFTPYGDIEHINILRTQRGQSSGKLLMLRLLALLPPHRGDMAPIKHMQRLIHIRVSRLAHFDLPLCYP